MDHCPNTALVLFAQHHLMRCVCCAPQWATQTYPLPLFVFTWHLKQRQFKFDFSYYKTFINWCFVARKFSREPMSQEDEAVFHNQVPTLTQSICILWVSFHVTLYQAAWINKLNPFLPLISAAQWTVYLHNHVKSVWLFTFQSQSLLPIQLKVVTPIKHNSHHWKFNITRLVNSYFKPRWNYNISDMCKFQTICNHL